MNLQVWQSKGRRALAVFALFPVFSFCDLKAQLKPSEAKCVVKQSAIEVSGISGNIRVDIYSPENQIVRGRILALTGAAGVLTHPTEKFDDIGQFRLACAGFVVYLPHYLEGTGDRSISDVSIVRLKGSKWLATVISVYRECLGTSGPNFLVGESLGGYLALAMSRQVEGVKGIALSSVGYKGLEATELPRGTSILDQHGAKDAIIIPEDAKQLIAKLRANDCLVRDITLPLTGHTLTFSAREEVVGNISAFVQELSK